MKKETKAQKLLREQKEHDEAVLFNTIINPNGLPTED